MKELKNLVEKLEQDPEWIQNRVNDYLTQKTDILEYFNFLKYLEKKEKESEALLEQAEKSTKKEELEALFDQAENNLLEIKSDGFCSDNDTHYLQDCKIKIQDLLEDLEDYPYYYSFVYNSKEKLENFRKFINSKFLKKENQYQNAIALFNEIAGKIEDNNSSIEELENSSYEFSSFVTKSGRPELIYGSDLKEFFEIQERRCD